MKILLLCAALSLSAKASLAQIVPPLGQTESPEPFKGANEILIHTVDSSAVALKKLARELIVAGIEPDKIEPEVGYLTTKAKAIGQLSPASYAYKVVSSREPGGTILRITGDYTVRLNAFSSMTNPMYWVKGNLLQAKQCFILIQPVALAYPGGRVAYRKTTK